ncbi:MAG TPA: DUF3017 domain-containing protein [Streptosporangiaceae bacterium]|nr:DUF3017 domain-containing protein [Streptosporangiaceae bacterium]
MTHASHEQATAETGRVGGGSGRHGGRRRRTGRPSKTGQAGQSRQPAGAAEAGQSRQADQAAQARYQQLPYLLVLFGVAAGLATIWQGVHLVQSGTLVLAGVLLVAAMARLVLPERRAGMLSSRRRFLDVALFGVLGTGLLVAGLVVPVPG